MERHVDFTIPGSPRLTFARYYNSLHHNQASRLFSHNWHHSFSYEISYSPDGTTDLLRPDGSVKSFGSSRQSADEPGVLLMQVDAAGLMTGATYTDGQGATETYDRLGRIARIDYAQGGFIAIAYNGDNPRLISVTDEHNRAIRFTYGSNTDSELKQITTPNGSIYKYLYNSSYMLSTVTGPDNYSITYSYDEYKFNLSGTQGRRLTGVTDERKIRTTSWTYDKFGQATSSYRGTGVDKTTVAYTPNGATVTNPLGGITEYQFSTVQRYQKSTSSTTGCPASSPCGLPLTTSSTYDFNGNVVASVDEAGSKTCYAYEIPRNLEIRRVSGLPGTVECADVLANYCAGYYR